MEWSEMLPELLDIIAHKHITFYEDYESFAGVCKSWRLAAARTYHNSNGPPSRLPSLMLADKSDYQESRELFLLSNKSIRKTQLPEAYGKARRSSCGWLLTVGKDLSSQLINPLSREIINLPKLDTFPKAIQSSSLYGPIQKVVVLMESKLVFVIWDFNKLGFCHIGDNKWTCVELNTDLRDITFYNGHIYCFDWNDKILACDVNGKDPVLVDVATMPRTDFHQNVSRAYIVGLDDDKRKQLLVIYKEAIFHHWQCPLKTRSFKVVAYDLESRNLSEVEDLGRKTLFLGLCSSFWTEDATEVIKGNCIYYTDDILLRYNGGKYRDMGGIYHLSDGTIEPLFAEELGESRLHYTPPLWLQPMQSFFTM